MAFLYLSLTICAFLNKQTFTNLFFLGISHFILAIRVIKLNLLAQNRILFGYGGFHVVIGLLFLLFSFKHSRSHLNFSKVKDGGTLIFAASIMSIGVLGWTLAFVPNLVNVFIENTEINVIDASILVTIG